MKTGALEILDGFDSMEKGFLSASHFAWRGRAPVLIDTGFQTRQAVTASILNVWSFSTAAME
jgi:hypothetical protein